jgi:hypothetical protein
VRRTVSLVATVAVLAVLATGCTSSGATNAQSPVSASASADAAGRAPATVQPAAASTAGPAWDSVLSQISADGSVSSAAALQAFALAFGPLPGVTVPAGGAGVLPDATGPMRWLVGHWQDLTAAQHAAALRLLPLPQTAAAPTSHALGEARSMTVTDVANKPVQKFQRQHTDSYYTDLATQAAADIAAKVGLSLSIPVTASDNGLTTDYYAVTSVYSASNSYVGTPAKCQIEVSAQGDQLGDADLERVIHHEVWHCFEGQVIGLARYWSAGAPQWIIEGEAEWVGTTSSPTAPTDSDFWDDYLKDPATPLFKRSYDAEGFYGQLQQSGTDMWSHLIPILQASGNPAAFEAAGGTGDPFLDAWASGYFRDASRGTPWDIVGPGVTADKPTPSRINVPVDSTVPVGAPPYADNVFSVIPGDADLERFTFSGHARVSDSSGHDYTIDNGELLACVNPKGCACPAGSAQAPPSQALDGLPIDLAVSGDPAGDNGTVHGESLQEFCSCGSNGTAIPAGTYSGPVNATITLTLHTGGQLTADGSGTSSMAGRITVVSDGTKATGTIALSLSGSSKLGLDGLQVGEDTDTGQMTGTVSGSAANPIGSGTVKGSTSSGGPTSGPFRAGLHLTKVGCTSISGDLVAMIAEIYAPVGNDVKVSGSGAWTLPRTP